MATDVTIPALGESITEATVGEWLKAPGDAVAADEPIVSLETDKVAVEVPSPVAGTMGEQLAKVGDTVNVGALIARIEASEGAPAKAKAPTPAVVEAPKAEAPPVKAEAPAKAEATSLPPAGGAEGGQSVADDKPAAAPDAQSPTPPTGDKGKEALHDAEPMAPAVRRLVGDYNLDPASIKGTGLDGRLTKGDVLAAVEAGTAKTLAPLPPAGGERRAAKNASA